MGARSIEEKLERVSTRLKSRPISVDQPVPEIHKPHPSAVFKDLGKATHENAVLWDVVGCYETALRFLADDPIVAQALKRGAELKRTIG